MEKIAQHSPKYSQELEKPEKLTEIIKNRKKTQWKLKINDAKSTLGHKKHNNKKLGQKRQSTQYSTEEDDDRDSSIVNSDDQYEEDCDNEDEDRNMDDQDEEDCINEDEDRNVDNQDEEHCDKEDGNPLDSVTKLSSDTRKKKKRSGHSKKKKENGKDTRDIHLYLHIPNKNSINTILSMNDHIVKWRNSNNEEAYNYMESLKEEWIQQCAVGKSGYFTQPENKVCFNIFIHYWNNITLQMPM
ncbi:MAG: hypothetical protein Q8Q60_05630 [Candidatus Chromulinivorax sp.]|nr:hypothetical protein [Candidatus Chromulinivorax sp.]